MREMIKRVREEKGGFTLAELLVVVAIVLVLVAIAVPVFTGAMGKANDAVLEANVRGARVEAGYDLLTNHSGAQSGLYHVTIYMDDSGANKKGDIVVTYTAESGSDTTPDEWDGSTNPVEFDIKADEVKDTSGKA